MNSLVKLFRVCHLAPRAKKIAQDEWEENRVELCQLYQSMTLESLMTTMRAKHDFKPSRQQLIFQFEKWGMLSPQSARQNEAPKLDTSNVQLGSPRALEDYNKRGRSTLSLRSFQTSQSGSKTWSSTKKSKPVEALAPDSQSMKNVNAGDAFADDSCPTEMDAISRLEKQKELPGDQISLTSDAATALGSADYMHSLVRATDSLGVEASSSSVDARGSNLLSSYLHEKASLRSSTWSCSTAEQPFLPARWGSAKGLAKSVTQADLDRPIDTSDEEISNIKEAAEYLTSFGFDEEAFPLQVLLLKRHLASLDDQGHGPCYLVYTSSHAAMSRRHCEILQYLLQLELAKAQQTESTLESFLAHMLLAETYCRGYSDSRGADVEQHVSMAKTLSPGIDLIRLLPEDNRSLDLLAWHNIVRCLTGNRDLLPKLHLHLYSRLKYMFLVLKVQDVEDALLRRIPGPFEIRDNVMGNPCLSFCAQWCNSELKHISKLPGSWKINDSASDFSWANVAALFSCLWGRWHEIESADRDPHLDVWVRETEARMGIPPAELLMTICMMISDSAGPRKLSRFDCDLIGHFRKGAHALLELKDKELARLFLQNIHERYNLSSVCTERLAFQRVARSHVSGVLKRVLLVSVPKESTSHPETHTTSSPPQQTLDILASAIIPKMASSPNSAEFSSLRKLRNRFKRTGDSVVQVAAALPSALGRNSSKSVSSVRPKSELSLATESSLNLAPMQTLGSSVR